MDAELIIRVRREPGYTIVAVAGEIDIATVAQLRERLFAVADSGCALIADLDQASFMDASGLARSSAQPGAPKRTGPASTWSAPSARPASCSASPGWTARSR